MTTPDASPSQLRADLLARLSPPTRDAVERIGSAARPHALYAVGGAVRDLLLQRETVDLDLVTESDAVELLATALPGIKLTAHARFRTASVVVAGRRIDLATARRETYARPGALPRVAPADLDADLRRRDFSIHAIALSLTGDPRLTDPCGGTADIRRRQVRILHDTSFKDDATRIFRAFRYAARLGFSLEPTTARALAESIPFIDAVGGERLRRELELILREPSAGVALQAAFNVGALGRIHPALSWDDARSSALARRLRSNEPLLPYGFALLAACASGTDAQVLSARLRLRRAEAQAVEGITAMRDIARTLRRPQAKPSGVTLLLDRFPLVAVAAHTTIESEPIARQLIVRYLEEWRTVKPILRGDDLIEMGVPAGPLVQRGLQLLRAARLDGWATDRDDERALALRFAKSIRDSKAAHSSIELNLN